MGKFEQLYDGDSFEIPNKSIFKFKCCDCGLVHNIAVAIEKNGNIGIALERNKKSTMKERKKLLNKEGE